MQASCEGFCHGQSSADFAKRVHTDSAILLRKTKLSETSLIVTWLSKAEGKLKTVAKGALQTKSKFHGVLDLFHCCEIQYARSRQSDLHILREATLIEPFEAIRYDYPRVALGAYFIELIDMTTEPDHPAVEIYDLLLRALAFLCGNAASHRALLHFENEIARGMGINEGGVSAALSISRAFHRLPPERAALLPLLE